MRAKMLLALFVVLTIVFASISAYEYLNFSIAAPTTTTVTATITAQPGTSQTQTLGSNPFPDDGHIGIGSVGYFIYTRIPILASGDPAASTTLENVTFTYLKPNATISGCVQYRFKATFQDGSSENLLAESCPTNFETAVVFSTHTTHHNSIPPSVTPTAGLILIPLHGQYIYALVSV